MWAVTIPFISCRQDFHPSGCSGQKPWSHSWYLIFLNHHTQSVMKSWWIHLQNISRIQAFLTPPLPPPCSLILPEIPLSTTGSHMANFLSSLPKCHLSIRPTLTTLFNTATCTLSPATQYPSTLLNFLFSPWHFLPSNLFITLIVCCLSPPY